MGGLKTIQAIAGAYSKMSYMPTGGITPANLTSYLKFPKVVACGRSWIVSRELLAARNY